MTTAIRGRERDWQRVSLWLLAAGSFVAGVMTVVGGLGVMMILGDLSQPGGFSLRGWALAVVYASQFVAILLGWIAFAFDRNRLAAALAGWPLLLGLLILIPATLQLL